MSLSNVYRTIINKFAETTVFNQVAIYNKQVQRLLRGQSYNIFLPACYIEITEKNVMQLLDYHTASDLDIRFHIVMSQLDSTDGSMDQNLYVYKLRNTVKGLFSLFKLDTGGFFQWVDEDQDYNHGNVYHYVIRYRAHQVDLTAVRELYPFEETPYDWWIWDTTYDNWETITLDWEDLFNGGPLRIKIDTGYDG